MQIARRVNAGIQYTTDVHRIFQIFYLPSSDGFSALAVGFWLSREHKLAMCQRFIGSIVAEPPFVRVAKRIVGDTRSAGITAEELEEPAWAEPGVEVSVRFLEWTKTGLLRQAARIALTARL